MVLWWCDRPNARSRENSAALPWDLQSPRLRRLPLRLCRSSTPRAAGTLSNQQQAGSAPSLRTPPFARLPSLPALRSGFTPRRGSSAHGMCSGRPAYRRAKHFLAACDLVPSSHATPTLRVGPAGFKSFARRYALGRGRLAPQPPPGLAPLRFALCGQSGGRLPPRRRFASPGSSPPIAWVPPTATAAHQSIACPLVMFALVVGLLPCQRRDHCYVISPIG